MTAEYGETVITLLRVFLYRMISALRNEIEETEIATIKYICTSGKSCIAIPSQSYATYRRAIRCTSRPVVTNTEQN